jgi:hypothetical protein
MWRTRLSLLACLILAVPALAAAPRDAVPTPVEEWQHERLQGQVAVTSAGRLVTVAVDAWSEDHVPDGAVDRVFLFETEQDFAPVDEHGAGSIARSPEALTIRLGQPQRTLVLRLGDAEAAPGDEPVRTIGHGIGIVERSSRYEGEELQRVAGLVASFEDRVLARRGGDLELVTGRDTQPGVATVEPDACASSCSYSCDGGSCNASCNAGYCADCYCTGSGAAYCSCTAQ